MARIIKKKFKGMELLGGTTFPENFSRLAGSPFSVVMFRGGGVGFSPQGTNLSIGALTAVDTNRLNTKKPILSISEPQRLRYFSIILMPTKSGDIVFCKFN